MSLIVSRLGSIAVLIKNTAHNLGGIPKTLVLKHLILITRLFLPILGIISTVMWNKYGSKKPESNGFPTILYAIVKRSGIMKRHHISFLNSFIYSDAGFGDHWLKRLQNMFLVKLSADAYLNFKDRIFDRLRSAEIIYIFNAPIAAIVLQRKY